MADALEQRSNAVHQISVSHSGDDAEFGSSGGQFP